LKNKFPRISDVKIKEGVFVGPSVRKLIQDIRSKDHLNEAEKAPWKSHQNDTTNFGEIIRQKTIMIWCLILENSTQVWGCYMSLEVHFLDSHLEFFPENIGEVSDQHRERFHQFISTMIKRYQGM